MRTRLLISAAAVAALLPLLAAESEQRPPEGPREIPYEEWARGVATRTVFTADSGEGWRAEVRDVVVAPGAKASDLKLPGAAVCEVRSGSGLIEMGGKSMELRIGLTFSIPEGTELGLEGRSELPLSIRVNLFRAD